MTVDAESRLRVLAPGCELLELESGQIEIAAHPFDEDGWSYTTASAAWALSELLVPKAVLESVAGDWINLTTALVMVDGIESTEGSGFR
jgi:hypothetical protein